MKNILTSATKIVLLLFAIAISIAFLFDIFTGKTAIETKDFMIPVMAVLGFYFANKGEKDKEYLGK